MIARDALAWGIGQLRDAGVPDPVRDARLLLARSLGIDIGRLTLELQDELSSDRDGAFQHDINLRTQRVPVSQILGTRAFYGRYFHVTADVLDPRPDTETLIACALSAPFRNVLDLGTGSGCILATLLSERPGAFGLGTDQSANAIAVAWQNCLRHDLRNRATLHVGNWFEPVEGEFDLIVSNPPYIALDEMADLQPEVRLHEPRMALTDEGDGLGAYRKIVAGFEPHLLPGGRLIFEIGPTQGEAVRAMMRDAGLQNVRVVQDIDGRGRVVVGKMPDSDATTRQQLAK